MFRSKLIVSLLIIILVPCLTTVESKCSKGCDLALGSYHSRLGLDFTSLTTAAMLARFNSYRPPLMENAVVNVTVNCSSGNASVSEAYGLFITYPLRVEDSLESIAAAEGVSGDLLQRFNPGANFSAGGVVWCIFPVVIKADVIHL